MPISRSTSAIFSLLAVFFALPEPIALGELQGVVKRGIENHKYFEENYDRIVKEYAGRIVAVISEKIVSVPFTSNISEAEKNFDILEREIGKENMGSAHITYIPKPNEILML